MLRVDVIAIHPFPRDFTTTTICQLVGETFRPSSVHYIKGLSPRCTGRLVSRAKLTKAEQSVSLNLVRVDNSRRCSAQLGSGTFSQDKL
jgi:hypothetical protein